MGWNQSTNSKANTSDSPRNKAKTSLVRGLVAAVIVVVGAVGAWWWLASGNDAKPKAAKPKPSAKIAEVTPGVAKRQEAEKPKKYADLTRDEKLAYYRNKYGDNLPENLKPIVYYLENPPQKKFEMPKRPESIFKHHSERTIASFLMVKPGTWIMNPIEFGAKFDADLAAALVEQIELSDDDTDDQRDLKTAVIETKKELAERIKNGEKASEILSEMSRQLYELGQYKSNLEDQVAKIRRDASMSDQDVQDAVNAANQMLKAKGLPPLKMPNMLIRHASLKRAAQRAAEKASQEK